MSELTVASSVNEETHALLGCNTIPVSAVRVRRHFFAPAGAHRECSVFVEASVFPSTTLPPSAPNVSIVYIGEFLGVLCTVSVCHQTRDNFLTGMQIEVATDSGNELPHPLPLSAPNASVSCSDGRANFLRFSRIRHTCLWSASSLGFLATRSSDGSYRSAKVSTLRSASLCWTPKG